VVTRKTERPDIEASDSHKFSIFYAQTRLLGFCQLGGEDKLHYSSEIGHGPFFAFCGIGNPQAFFDDLSRGHVVVAGQKIFRDHHRYSDRDLANLMKEARRAGAMAFVTTEKDACNIREGQGIALPIFVSVIDFVFTSESEFVSALERKLATSHGAQA
jgi:tetraacyldisaccharide 4'-kinase